MPFAAAHGAPAGFNLQHRNPERLDLGRWHRFAIDGHWSVKVEDMFGDFDDQDYNLGPDPVGADKLLTTQQSLDNLFRFGVNYKF